MRREVRLRRNADGTITVRVGRAVEHVDARGRTENDLYETLRWALISKGASLERTTLLNLLDDARGGR